jgi:hypothetical protein
MSAPIAYDVFQNGKIIDTIFYDANSNVSCDEVKKSLIEHDGYPDNIIVKKVKRK